MGRWRQDLGLRRLSLSLSLSLSLFLSLFLSLSLSPTSLPPSLSLSLSLSLAHTLSHSCHSPPPPTQGLPTANQNTQHFLKCIGCASVCTKGSLCTPEMTRAAPKDEISTGEEEWQQQKVDILLCSECMQRARRHVRRMGYGPYAMIETKKEQSVAQGPEQWSGRHWTGGARPTAHAYNGKGGEREFWHTLRPSLAVALVGSGASGFRNPYYDPAVAAMDAASARRWSYEFEAFELWPWYVFTSYFVVRFCPLYD